MSGVIDHADVKLSLNATLLSSLDLEAGRSDLIQTALISLSNGTATGNASQMWSDTRTLTASATENLDLAASLVNVFGTTLTFVKLKFAFFRASTANTNDVQVQRATANGVVLFMAALDGIALSPGEWFCYASPTVGKTITAATGDLFTITNSAGSTSVTYDVVFIGTD